MNETARSPAIEVSKLTKRFGEFVAVDHIDFNVEKGEIFGFLGPNGSGKSTTIRMLCGLMDPSEGDAKVLGLDVRKNPEMIKKQIGYMSQKFSLYEDLEVIQNLDFYAGIYQVPRNKVRDRIRFVLEMSNLFGREKELVANLSVGWKQRLALGCAMIHEPSLIFLDEPTGGVDPISRKNFWTLLRQLARQGTTLFVTTHYMDEAEHCDRLGFIYEGRLVAIGEPGLIKSQMAETIIEVYGPNTEILLKTLSDSKEVGDVVVHGSALHLTTRKPEQALESIRELITLHGIEGAEAEVIPPSLEDVFVSLIKNKREINGP